MRQILLFAALAAVLALLLVSCGGNQGQAGADRGGRSRQGGVS